LGTNFSLNVCLERLRTDLKSRGILELWGADALILLSFTGQLDLAALEHLKDDIVVDKE